MVDDVSSCFVGSRVHVLKDDSISQQAVHTLVSKTDYELSWLTKEPKQGQVGLTVKNFRRVTFYLAFSLVASAFLCKAVICYLFFLFRVYCVTCLLGLEEEGTVFHVKRTAT